MPNHVHGVVFINLGTGVIDSKTGTGGLETGTACRAPTVERFGKPVSGSLPTIIRSFKSAVTKQGREFKKYENIWQRNYHERIIRDDRELETISTYIQNNPINWQEDKNNPACW